MRTTMRAISCLLFGTFLTVVVAWAAAIYYPFTRAGWEITHDPIVEDGRIGGWRVPEGWDVRTHGTLTGAAIQYEIVTEMPWMGSRLMMMMDSTNRSMDRTRAGWPFYASQSRGSMDERVARPGPLAGLYLQGIEVPSIKRRRLPLTPLWTGLILNTIVYAAALFAVSITPRLLVRAHRRRRGRCAQCGYDLRTPRTCPECGPSAAR